jgi:hypothetical protein
MRFSPLRTLTTLACGLCCWTSLAWAGNGEALVDRVPSSMEGVAVLDVARVRDTSFVSRAMPMLQRSQAWTSRMGTLTRNGFTFSPATDIQTLMLLVPDVNASDPTRGAGLILEATFDVDQLLAAAAAAGSEVQTEGDIRWFQRGADRVAVLAPGVLAMGPAALVEQVVAAQGPSRGLRAQIRAADKGRSAWFAASADRPLEGFTAGHGALDLGATLSLTATGATPSAEAAAEQVAVVGRQKVRLQADATVAALGLMPLVEGVQAEAREDRVVVTLRLDAAAWSSLANQLLAIIESEL